jgi:hypothetical protein
MLAYLVLLRVEIARFTRLLSCPKSRLVSVALILTSRWRGVTSYAVLCSPDVPPVRPFGPMLSRRLFSYAPAAVWRASRTEYRWVFIPRIKQHQAINTFKVFCIACD